jgi:hypothetical protein
MFTSISGDVLVDPLHFGQRTIQDIALDSLNDNYFLHYIPEYYVEPDQFPSDPNNVLYSMLKKFYVYNSEIRDYVECEMFDNIVLVPAAYVLSNDVASSPREFYFLCTTNFETYLKDGGDYLGEFYCKDVFLKLPFGPNGGQVSDPAWLW